MAGTAVDRPTQPMYATAHLLCRPAGGWAQAGEHELKFIDA
jgi:hypothetical protein